MKGVIGCVRVCLCVCVCAGVGVCVGVGVDQFDCGSDDESMMLSFVHTITAVERVFVSLSTKSIIMYIIIIVMITDFIHAHVLWRLLSQPMPLTLPLHAVVSISITRPSIICTRPRG